MCNDLRQVASWHVIFIKTRSRDCIEKNVWLKMDKSEGAY